MSGEINKQLIEKFYCSFSNYDYKSMGECYHNDIIFHDNAFGTLKGKDPALMWEMLITGSQKTTHPLEIKYSNIIANENTGSAHWIATYSFSSTGRLVVNSIQASFVFKDGLIIQHTDVFDFWKWSSQALGLSGYLFGWTKCLHSKVSTQANEKLIAYKNKKYGNTSETENVLNNNSSNDSNTV